MPFDVRPITPDELDTMLTVDRRGFGGAEQPEGISRAWVEAEIDRTRCVFDGDEMVGCSRGYSFELTVPGGARVPVSAISAVAVQPTHRRRGVLSQMIPALHADARDRGEPAAILTASEGAIYGRFGYGITTWRLGITAERGGARFVAPNADRGRMRLVERDEAEKVIPGVYERTRHRAGAVSRPDFWWPSVFWGLTHGPDKAFFVAVHEDASGDADGYVAYEISGEWNRGLPDRRLLVWDLQSTSPATHAALWEYVFGVDLVGTIASVNSAIDDPLRLLVADARRIRVDFVNDGLWLCPLDIRALLGSRRYTVAGSITFEIRTAGGDRVVVALDGGPEGANASSTTESPHLMCDASTLGACFLGGTTWTTMAAAGRVEEHGNGALARADAMFSTTPAPAMLSFF